MVALSNQVVLAETHTLTESRGEASDADRQSLSLAETQTITDARGEARDSDRENLTLAETQTMSKASGEATDSDPTGLSENTITWEHGTRVPLLFRNAVGPKGEAPHFRYDRALAMSIVEDGTPLIHSRVSCETMTHTAARGEQDDSDQ